MNIHQVNKTGETDNSLPDFIIAGFNRCGTSTLHALLDQHPRICMSRPKEVHYFNFDATYRHGPQIYDSVFAHCDTSVVRGEATPSYIYNGLLFQGKNSGYYYDPGHDSIIRLASDAPATKLILSLRHPVDAALSHFNKAQLQEREALETRLIDAMHAEWAGERRITETDLCYFYLTSYSRHIRHLLAHIPREQVIFLIFEEWTTNQKATLDRISHFLGLEKHEPEQDAAIVRNTGREAAIPGLRDVLRTILPQRLAMPVYRRLATRNGYTGISEADARTIAAQYHEEIKALETLIGRDLSIWNIPGHHNAEAGNGE